ncbi:MAG: hypothetical protein GXO40_01025 [Epsilonproteobacteria bacterium]|nr:hypothetical protein [Campylobacterota bacterium]
MELKLVTTHNKTKTVSKDEFLTKIKKDSFFYFHRDTSYKDLQDLIDEISTNHSVYFREVKYSLEENGYMYEMHII